MESAPTLESITPTLEWGMFWSVENLMAIYLDDFDNITGTFDNNIEDTLNDWEGQCTDSSFSTSHRAQSNCPYSIKDKCVATDGYNLQYLTETLELKKNHTYYYQLQTYLGIYGYSKGYFCVWTPHDVLLLEIAFDKNFWCSLKKDLLHVL